MLNMSTLLLCLLLCMAAWTTITSAFAFTNSFSDWVGNSTHTISWDSSTSDPDWYDLTLVRSYDIYAAGVEVEPSWPMDWSMNVATHISASGDHVIQFTLPPDCWPGVYYWVLQASKKIPVSTTFLISAPDSPSSPSTAMASPTSDDQNSEETVTVSSYVLVTATESMIDTYDGHLVTLKPSDVFSSAIVYTTIVVSDQGGDIPPVNVQTIVAATLAALFLITVPITVWIVLRYRRRPTSPSDSPDSPDKRSPPDPEGAPDSSTLDLLESSTPNSTSNNPSASTETTRQVWAIVDGEKRLITVPRYPPRPGPLVQNADPFADPIIHARPGALPRLHIPESLIQSNSSSPSSSTPVDTLSRRNTTLSRTTASLIHSRHEPSLEIYTDILSSTNATRLAEKLQPRRQRPAPEPQPLSPEDITSRTFIAGRAVDMGPLGRYRIGDVDENGLLPPDYWQATQPVSSQQPQQAGPGAH